MLFQSLPSYIYCQFFTAHWVISNYVCFVLQNKNKWLKMLSVSVSKSLFLLSLLQIFSIWLFLCVMSSGYVLRRKRTSHAVLHYILCGLYTIRCLRLKCQWCCQALLWLSDSTCISYANIAQSFWLRGLHYEYVMADCILIPLVTFLKSLKRNACNLTSLYFHQHSSVRNIFAYQSPYLLYSYMFSAIVPSLCVDSFKLRLAFSLH